MKSSEQLGTDVPIAARFHQEALCLLRCSVFEMGAGVNTSWGQAKSQRKSQGGTEIWWDACSAGPQIHTDSSSSWAA